MKVRLKRHWWAFVVGLWLVTTLQVGSAMRCWQCAAVDGRRCPEDAKLVRSPAHDACITWRVGNGTVLLQNLVRFDEECIGSKVDFWSRFIDLYYQVGYLNILWRAYNFNTISFRALGDR